MSHLLYLGTGLQSSGTTLVSWSFLQRTDMDGVLDAPYHRLPDLDRLDARRLRWYKHAIACFRATEIIAHFEDFGREVRPILVIRDVRSVWNSLASKHYGRNATTSKDPPLRLRFRRFLEDWCWFRKNDLPIVRYESLVERPKSTLRDACGLMGLHWDEAMLTWPKPASAVMDAFWGNATFHRNKASSLASSLRRSPLKEPLLRIMPADLQWLEEAFSTFFEVHDYPLTRQHELQRPVSEQGWSTPRFRNSRLYLPRAPYYFLKEHIARSKRLRRWAIRIQFHPRFPRKGARKL